MPSGLVLANGETIRYQGRLSWQANWFWFLLALIFIPTGVGVILTLLFIGIAVLTVYSSQYIVTNQRVYIRYGIIGRNIRELKNEWITNYAIHQGLFGRILGYGNVVFSTPGFITGASSMIGVGNPLGVKSIVDQIVTNVKDVQTIKEKLKRLEEEHDYGRIDDAKYNELKKKYEEEQRKF
jgi:uncharacterized membrane protein YdbT with pleckstrin-like domain